MSEPNMQNLPFLSDPCLLALCCLNGPEQGFPTLAPMAFGRNHSSQVWAALCLVECYDLPGLCSLVASPAQS